MLEPASWHHDHTLLASDPSVGPLLAAIGARVAVLDPDRRFVWLSPDLVAFLGATVPGPLLGRRPGDVLHCVHAGETLRGCGGSPACYDCGLVGAVLETRRTGLRVTRPVRVEPHPPAPPVDLTITAAPWVYRGRHLTVVTLGV